VPLPRSSAAPCALVLAAIALAPSCNRSGGSTTVRVPAYAPGSTVPGYVARVPLQSVGDVVATGSLIGGDFRRGASVPGSRLRFSTGSAADVAAVGTYVDGVWLVAMERSLVTADPENDVQFEAGGVYHFQVATFDDEGGAAEGLGMTGASREVFSIRLPDSLPGPIEILVPPTNLVSLEGFATLDRLRLNAAFLDRNGVENVAPRAWVFDGMAWSRTTGDEDRLAFYWALARDLPIGTGPGTTGTGTCAVMCHSGIGEWTVAGKLDAWQWRAGTSNFVGALVDGLLDSTDGGGRKPDAGRLSPRDNVDEFGVAPLVMGEFDPGERARALLETPEGAARAVPFDDAAAFRRGDRVPGFIATPLSGSFGDVSATSAYENGVWTVTLERELVTSDPENDVQFEPGRSYAFQVAVFDNEPGTAEAIGMTSESERVFFVRLPATPGPLSFSRRPQKLSDLSGETTADGRIRLTVSFPDANRRRDATREPWVFDGVAWSRVPPAEADEDRFAILFAREPDVPLGVGPGTTGTGTCVIMCHTGRGMFTPSGHVDLWEWAASSTDPVGAAADLAIGPDLGGGSGRTADSGAGGPRPNFDTLSSMPPLVADGDPGRRARSLLAPSLSGGPASLPAGSSRAIPFGLAEWTVTLRRTLKTGDPARDVQFVADGATQHFFQVATFDNETGRAQNVGMTDGADETFSVVIPAPDGLPDLQDLVFPSRPTKLTSLTGTYDDAATPSDFGDDSLTIVARFRDRSNQASRRRSEWFWTGTTWSRGTSGSEDMLSLLFSLEPGVDLGIGPGTTGTGTCATTCHVDRGEWTAAGRLDSWLWAAARTDASGFALDDFWDDTVGGGRHPDPGEASFVENENAPRTEPALQSDSDPDANALHLVLARGAVERAVPISDASYGPGSSVPGFVLENGFGSRADVRAAAFHDPASRRWSLTLRRSALTIDAANDVQFRLGRTVSFQAAFTDDTSFSAGDARIPGADSPVTMTLPGSGDFRGREEVAISFSRTPPGFRSISGAYNAGKTPSDPSDDFVTLTLVWSDATESTDGSGWTRSESGAWRRNDPSREDRFSMIFSLGADVPLGLGLGTTGTGTCATMCHSGGTAFAAASGKVDAWSWSGGRFGAHSFLDDGRVDGIGPAPDAGDPSAVENLGASGDAPAFAPEGGPSSRARAIADWAPGVRRSVPFVAMVDESKYGEGGGGDGAVTFSRTIRPIINSNCACHLNAQTSGGLNMDSHANLLRGGQSRATFPAVVPGDGASSLIFLKVSQDRPPVGQRMPLGGPFLSPDDQQRIREWIDQGALDN